MCMSKIITNCPCGNEYHWFNKHQHFKDIKHENIKCGCGSEYSLEQQHRHLISHKHQLYLGNEKKVNNCKCGGHFREYGDTEHYKTKRHQQYLKQNNLIIPF